MAAEYQDISDRTTSDYLSPEEQSFGERAYREYGQAIYRFALHYSQDPTYADDVVQETVIRAMTRAQQFRDNSHERALENWLFGIARNYMRDQYRKIQPVSLESHIEMTGIELSEDSHTHDSTEDESEAKRRTLTNVLSHLPNNHREAVVSRYIDGKPISEIAITVGKTEHAVRTMLSRALRQASNSPDEPAQRDKYNHECYRQQVLTTIGNVQIGKEYRDVLLAHYRDNLDYQQIAERFGITPQAVKSRLFRGRKLLSAATQDGPKT